MLPATNEQIISHGSSWLLSSLTFLFYLSKDGFRREFDAESEDGFRWECDLSGFCRWVSTTTIKAGMDRPVAWIVGHPAAGGASAGGDWRLRLCKMTGTHTVRAGIGHLFGKRGGGQKEGWV